MLYNYYKAFKTCLDKCKLCICIYCVDNGSTYLKLCCEVHVLLHFDTLCHMVRHQRK